MLKGFSETMRRYRTYVSTDYPATVHLGIEHLTHCDADSIRLYEDGWYHSKLNKKINKT